MSDPRCVSFPSSPASPEGTTPKLTVSPAPTARKMRSRNASPLVDFSFCVGVFSTYLSSPPARSIHRNAFVVTFSGIISSRVSLYRRLRCALGFQLRRLLFPPSSETRFPKCVVRPANKPFFARFWTIRPQVITEAVALDDMTDVPTLSRVSTCWPLSQELSQQAARGSPGTRNPRRRTAE